MTPSPNLRWFRWSLRAMFAVTFGWAMLLMIFLVLPRHVMEGHPVSIANLARVQVGMVGRDVEHLLGKPRTHNGRLWTYSGSTWCVVRIRFDSNGFVSEIDHDH
jgi:outer membrane protein assembly factor BamE (lipoprotein component of BamABCDE complex)